MTAKHFGGKRQKVGISLRKPVRTLGGSCLLKNLFWRRTERNSSSALAGIPADVKRVPGQRDVGSLQRNAAVRGALRCLLTSRGHHVAPTWRLLSKQQMSTQLCIKQGDTAQVMFQLKKKRQHVLRRGKLESVYVQSASSVSSSVVRKHQRAPAGNQTGREGTAQTTQTQLCSIHEKTQHGFS